MVAYEKYWKALEFNWSYLRHMENSRRILLILYFVFYAASLILLKWWFFAFLSILSYFIFIVCLKLHAEAANAYFCIAWCGEKLGVLIPIPSTKTYPIPKETYEKFGLKPSEMEDMFERAIHRGYLARPLLLPVRVHEALTRVLYLLVSSANGLTVYTFTTSIFPTSAIWNVGTALTAFFSTLGILILTAKWVRRNAKLILTLRKPSDVEMANP